MKPRLVPGDEIVLVTDAGERICRIAAAQGHAFRITTPMGIPGIAKRSVSLNGGGRIDGAAVSTGNPHFVIFVDEEDFAVKGRSWQTIGDEISKHPDFPRQTNVEFVRLVSRNKSRSGSTSAGWALVPLREPELALRLAPPFSCVERKGPCRLPRLEEPNFSSGRTDLRWC